MCKKNSADSEDREQTESSEDKAIFISDQFGESNHIKRMDALRITKLLVARWEIERGRVNLRLAGQRTEGSTAA